MAFLGRRSLKPIHINICLCLVILSCNFRRNLNMVHAGSEETAAEVSDTPLDFVTSSLGAKDDDDLSTVARSSVKTTEMPVTNEPIKYVSTVSSKMTTPEIDKNRKEKVTLSVTDKLMKVSRISTTKGPSDPDLRTRSPAAFDEKSSTIFPELRRATADSSERDTEVESTDPSPTTLPTSEPTSSTIQSTLSTHEPTFSSSQSTLSRRELSFSTIQSNLSRSEPTSSTIQSSLSRSEPTSSTMQSSFSRSEPTSSTIQSSFSSSKPTLNTIQSNFSRNEPNLRTVQSTLGRSDPPSSTIHSTLTRREPTSRRTDSTPRTTEPLSTEMLFYTTGKMSVPLPVTSMDSNQVTMVITEPPSRWTRGAQTSDHETLCDSLIYDDKFQRLGVGLRGIDEYTRVIFRGEGIFGNDSWSQTEEIDEDEYVSSVVKDEVIPGEVYLITTSWCNDNTCPFNCSPTINVSEDLDSRYIDHFEVIEVTATSAKFSWISTKRIYAAELAIRLDLLNNMTSVNRGVATDTTEVYAMEGNFTVDGLVPGARYRIVLLLDLETNFSTVPQAPEGLSFHQETYKSVRLQWYQSASGYADRFNVFYRTEENTPIRLTSEDYDISLDDLHQNVTYNVSVTAETGNLSSAPASVIIQLAPPTLNISVLDQDTFQVTVSLTSSEMLQAVEVDVDGSPYLSFDIITGYEEFNITDLTPGERYRLKASFKTGELRWKVEEDVYTKPLPPSKVSGDTTHFGQLNVCWTLEGTYDYAKVRIYHADGLIAVEKYTETSCHTQSVEGGTLYEVRLVAVSNGLDSEAVVNKFLSEPGPPLISEVSKTSSSVQAFISCPQTGLADHVSWFVCRSDQRRCQRRNNFRCRNSSFVQSVNESDLEAGTRYWIGAKAVQIFHDLRAESEEQITTLTTPPNPPTDIDVVKISGLAITIKWQSDCGECVYRIIATPHNRTLSDVEKYSSCENRYDDVCEFSFSVIPEKSYDVQVTSIIFGEESLTGATYKNISMPYAIKKPTEISLVSVTPTLLQMDFKPPDVPSETIAGYLIDYSGQRLNGDVCHENKRVWILSAQTRPIDLSVKGGCFYNFTIKTFFGAHDEGEVAWKTINTTVGVLRPSEQVPRYPDQNSLNHHSFAVSFDPTLFDDDNGPVDYYTVIVAEDVTGSELKLGGNVTGWRQAIGNNPVPPYQAFPKRPATSYNGISKRSVAEPVHVVIGGEDCEGSVEYYCNGHLIGGRKYVYWIRGFNAAGLSDSRPSPSFLLPKNQSPLIIGCLIILMILFLIVIILVGLLLRKRLHLDNRGGYQPAPTNSVLLQSMSRNSSRAKYIRAIKLSEFCQDFHIMSAHSNYGYSQEFENVRRVGRKMTCYDAVLPENVAKNRYTNILPYDKTRVRLGSVDDDMGSDYINANYIPGFSSPREYIACQGPLPGTVDDMWRMIWEQSVSTVVMVTQLVEKGKVKCEQYWPEDHKPVFYGDIQVAMTQRTESESWNLREFCLYKPSVDQRKKVKHYNYLSWPDHGVPQNSESLLNFIHLVRQQNQTNTSPIIVHCSAGCGRTGTFICLDRLIQEIEDADYVNILGTIAEMRSHRQHMIQTEQQYVFVHRCVLDILEERGIAPRPSSIPMNGNSGGTFLMEMI